MEVTNDEVPGTKAPGPFGAARIWAASSSLIGYMAQAMRPLRSSNPLQTRAVSIGLGSRDRA
jgi:hypothetical protein